MAVEGRTTQVVEKIVVDVMTVEGRTGGVRFVQVRQVIVDEMRERLCHGAR